MATILVADDDQLLRAILRDQLERADHAVLEAGDGMAAVDIALDERPDVLLLDVMMPLARGLEVVRRVRQQQDWHPVILMISARTRVTDRFNALEAGADAYFEKPFAPDDLLQAIERLTTEAQPARYIDVLGPLWATIAIRQLAEDAFARRRPGPSRDAHVEELFTRLVADSIGRMPGSTAPNGSAASALRRLWGDAVRALLRDSVEADPVVGNVTLADALAAVERASHEALQRHRAQLELPATLPSFWHDALTRTLTTRAPSPSPAPQLGREATEGWSHRLRRVLDARDTPDAIVQRWSQVLGGVLASSDAAVAAVPTIDPLGPVWLAAAARSGRSVEHR